MEAGKLRHRVTIQKPVRSESAQSGEVELEWQDIGQAWAEIRPTNGREQQLYAQTGEQVSHVITCRYTTAITTDCRLAYRGRFFDVSGVTDVDERRRELRITATEQVP
jgi:SPP1 family predicted phage head-tail adaptor